jgi:hypothetical protein
MPFNPTDELDMRLTVAEWNAVLAHLQEGRYKDTAALIAKINVQAAQHEAQTQPAPPVPPAPPAPGYTNGEVREGDTVTVTGDTQGTITLAPDK